MYEMYVHNRLRLPLGPTPATTSSVPCMAATVRAEEEEEEVEEEEEEEGRRETSPSHLW